MDGADQNAGHQTEFVLGKVCTNAHIFKGTAKNPKDKVFKATSSKATPRSNKKWAFIINMLEQCLLCTLLVTLD